VLRVSQSTSKYPGARAGPISATIAARAAGVMGRTIHGLERTASNRTVKPRHGAVKSTGLAQHSQAGPVV
jgi:hypothetical protein